MLSERRNYGRIHVNPLVWLGYLNVLFPVDELASHTHPFTLDSPRKGRDGGSAWYVDSGTIGDKNEGATRETESTGNAQPHNNMEPYKVVYIFKRTA